MDYSRVLKNRKAYVSVISILAVSNELNVQLYYYCISLFYKILPFYKALIRSILEYVTPIWNPNYNIHINNIERVLTTQFLAYKDTNCATARSSEIKLNSLVIRRKSSDIKTLHKIVHGIHISTYIKNLCHDVCGR